MFHKQITATAQYIVDESRYAMENPSLGRLVQATVSAEQAGQSIAVASLEHLNDLSWVEDIGLRWLKHLLTKNVTSPVFPGSPMDGGSDVIKTGLVHRTSGCAIALQAFDAAMLATVKKQLADAEIDVLVGRPNVIKIANRGNLTVEIAEYEQLTEHQDFDLPIRAMSRRQITISRKSAALIIDGRYQSFRFTDAKDDPLVINIADLATSLPFRVHVNRNDGTVTAVHANDDKDNVVRTMMSVLRQLSNEDRESILRKYAEHGTHFVRWHAIRELAILKRDQILPDLCHWAQSEPSLYLKRYINELHRSLTSNRTD